MSPLKGSVPRFYMKGHRTISNAGIRLALSVFNFLDPLGRCGRFNGVYTVYWSTMVDYFGPRHYTIKLPVVSIGIDSPPPPPCKSGEQSPLKTLSYERVHLVCLHINQVHLLKVRVHVLILAPTLDHCRGKLQYKLALFGVPVGFN